MLPLISNITGFDKETFTPIEIFKEANRKFAETYMIVNDELMQVSSFNYNDHCLKTSSSTIYGDDVFSIKPWMPQAGIYKTKKDSYVYLYRLPRRQWLKSISLGNNYDAFFLHNYMNATNAILNPIYTFSKVDNEIDETRNWLVLNKQVIFKYHKVGEIQETNWPFIKVIDKRFFQEVYDKWNKQYSITTT